MKIIELLKDVPKGTKLYSPICGDCFLDNVYGSVISVKKYTPHNNFKEKTLCFDEYGRIDLNGECLLFPSKENRDWNRFKSIPYFRVGEILYVKTSNGLEICFINKGVDTFDRLLRYVSCDVNSKHFFIDSQGYICFTSSVEEIRKATEEEKKKLFDTIKENGYVWDAEVLELFKKDSNLTQL